MKTLRRVLIVPTLVAGFLFALPRVSEGTVYLGWADEFMVGHIICNHPVAGVEHFCELRHLWAGHANPLLNTRWSYLGAQGVSAAGRANAVEKVQFSFREAADDQCAGITVTLSRWRRTSPPAEGTACNDGIQFAAGSSSYTRNSCAGGNADHLHNHRTYPRMDFSQESPTVGQTIGYRSRVQGQNDYVPSDDAYEDGCYKIYWF